MRAVSIEFRGQVYTVPSHRAFALGDAVETVATLATILSWNTDPPFRKLSQCYGVVLRFAGVQIEGREISDEDVLEHIIGQVKILVATGVAPKGLYYQQIIEQLVAMLLDGMPEAAPQAAELAPAKKKRGSSSPCSRSR